MYFRRFHASVGDIVAFFDKTFWDMRSPPAPPSTFGRNAVHIFPAGVFQAVPCICRRPDAGEARSDFPQWRSVPSGSRLKVPCCAHNCARKHATARATVRASHKCRYCSSSGGAGCAGTHRCSGKWVRGGGGDNEIPGGLFGRNSVAQYRTQVNFSLLQDLF